MGIPFAAREPDDGLGNVLTSFPSARSLRAAGGYRPDLPLTVLLAETPYDDQRFWGLLAGVARRFRPRDVAVVFEEEDAFTTARWRDVAAALGPHAESLSVVAYYGEHLARDPLLPDLRAFRRLKSLAVHHLAYLEDRGGPGRAGIAGVMDEAQLGRLERLEFSGIAPGVLERAVGPPLPALRALVLHDADPVHARSIVALASRCPRLATLVCSVSEDDSDPEAVAPCLIRVARALPLAQLAVECDPSMRGCVPRVAALRDPHTLPEYDRVFRCAA